MIGAALAAAESAAPAALAAVGLALLAPAPGAAIIHVAGLGVGTALWLGLWFGLTAEAGAALARWAPDRLDLLGPTLLNIAFATIAWAPAALALAGTYRLPPAPRLVSFGAALVWLGGLIAPHLGRGGLWPTGSVALALWCAALAICGATLANRHRRALGPASR